MCLIVTSENGKLIDTSDLEIAYSNNPDGVGVMWLENGRVRERQILPKTFNDVKNLAWDVAGYPHAMHLRYCTRGEVTEENCHPFTVLSTEHGDSCDMSLMHNGTFQWITLNEDQKKAGISDTGEFARRIQKNLRLEMEKQVEHVEKLFDPAVISKMSSRVSTWNKVVLLNSDGRWLYFNKVQGTERNGMWYSNVYSLKEGYRHQQVTHHGPTSNYTSYMGSNAYSYGTKDWSTKSESTTSTKKEAKKQKFDNATTYFKRSPLHTKAVYMIKSSNQTDTFVLVDTTNFTELQTGKRLGKTERKLLRRFLAIEENKTESKFEPKQLVDHKGRKVFTQAPKESIKEAEVEIEIETEDVLEDALAGYPTYGMFH